MADSNQWPGLISVVDPHDLPLGGATVQDNFQSRELGKLAIRKGLRIHVFDNAPGSGDADDPSADVLAMYAYHPILAQYAVFLCADGKVFVGNATEAVSPLETDVCIDHPSCWAETRQGKLIRVNGLERGTIYNGADLWEIGVTAPTAAPTVNVAPGSGGAIHGTYYCAYRFIDAEGIPSSLSPFAEVDAENGDGFSWSALATSAESRVTKVQLFRSSTDQADTLYFVKEINNGTATYASDFDSDPVLMEDTPLPILNPDGTLHARRFTPPPEDMEVVVPFQDRYWYAVPSKISVASYQSVVNGWTSSVIGRYAYKEDALPKPIAASGDVTGYSFIYAAPTERNLLRFSEVDEPESVPRDQNQIVIQENTDDNDYITGLMPHGAVLWVLKERHVYRVQFVRQPTIDASVVLAYSRGCINQQCWDYYEDDAYLMDEYGCWMLSPGGYKPISAPIDNYFQDPLIDFSKKKWFFTCVEPNEAVVRFFVSLTGDSADRPTRALCYSIRTGSWWTESYLWEFGGSCRVASSGKTRVLLGGEDGDVYRLSAGNTDICTAEVAGTVTAADSTSLSDSTQTFTNAAHKNAPVAITAGTGKGQIRRVSNAAGNALTVSEAWDTTPDTTSHYLVGAIKGTYKSGLYSMMDYGDEGDQDGGERAFTLVHQPTAAAYLIDMSLYYDHEESAENWAITREDGPVKFKRNQAEVEISTIRGRSTLGNSPGYARVPFHMRATKRFLSHRFLSTGLQAFQGDEAIQVYGVDLQP